MKLFPVNLSCLLRELTPGSAETHVNACITGLARPARRFVTRTVTYDQAVPRAGVPRNALASTTTHFMEIRNQSY